MTLTICVLLSPAPREVMTWELTVPQGTTVADALAQVPALPACLARAGLPPTVAACRVGVWGRMVLGEHVLRDQDRLEIYRPLTVDPKVARRERFQKQGRRSAGLFARKKTVPQP